MCPSVRNCSFHHAMMDDRHLATWPKSQAKQDGRMTTQDIMLDHNGTGGDQWFESNTCCHIPVFRELSRING